MIERRERQKKGQWESDKGKEKVRREDGQVKGELVG